MYHAPNACWPSPRSNHHHRCHNVCQADEQVASQVFVAGATGRLGCRVVLELLQNKKLKVRAGARNPEEARNLVKTATDYGILTGDAARRLTVVPVDLEDEDSIAPAVGNAGRVGPLLRCLLFAICKKKRKKKRKSKVFSNSLRSDV